MKVNKVTKLERGNMKIILDTAKIEDIKKVKEFFPSLLGVTTNPSILAKESEDLSKTLKELKEVCSDELEIHVQTTESEAEKMLEEAKALKAFFGENFHMKLPMTEDGIKAIKLLSDAGIKTTVTTIFSPNQALLAAECGATYVAPYVNRLDNITADGVTAVEGISEIFNNFDYKTKILGASFKNVQQIYEVALVGCDVVTITPDLLYTIIRHPYTEKSLVDFEKDWKNKYGDKKVIDFLK